MSLKFIASSKLPTPWGEFGISVFLDESSNKEHVALSFGKLDPGEAVLCRIHSECLTGDALFSLRCDCGSQLQAAMEAVAANGKGLILYLRQEGRNIGLGNKIRAYALQDQGADTVEANEALGFGADERLYDACKDMLRHFGVKELRLMTNNPAKVTAMQELGFKVSERLPVVIEANTHNKAYLATKRNKLGHL